MKILVIGDFHGKFTDKQFNKLKKEDFDIILSVGDFCGNVQLSKIGFKYYWGKSKEEVAKIPKRILQLEKKLDKKSVTDGVIVLKKLRKFGKKFLSVHGNWDPVPWGNDLPRTSEEAPKDYDLKRFHEFKKRTSNLSILKLKILDLL